ncbi:MAG: PAS domain-containing sensor histidine kinase [Chloroflexota bacterium]
MSTDRSGSAGWLHAVMEENPEVIALFRPVLDAGGTFVDAEIVAANRATRDRWFGGCVEADLVGRHLFRDWPHLRPMVFEPYAAAVRERRLVRRELRIVWQHVDIWADLTVYPFEGGFAHMSRDVTEARRATLALVEAEERFRLSLEHAIETIAIYRPILDSAGRFADATVVFANRVGRERWLGGASLEEVEGRPLYATWPELRSFTEPLYRQVVETGIPCVGPWVAPAAQGGRTYDLRITPFPGGFIHMSMDVTDRVQAQGRLRALADSLELRVAERTADLEAFTRTASHDLRAPLRAIAGYAGLLQRRAGDRLDADGRRYVDNILAASTGAGHLVEDLLCYARVGQGAVRAEPVPVGPIVDGVAATLGARIAAAGGRLVVEAPLAVPVGDPLLLERILVNLVDNAITYQAPGVAPQVAVRCRASGGRAVLEVRDNGIGIDPAEQERVFEVFTRLHDADRYPGTGMGLSIVRRAARLMGSDVTLRSAPGKGSTFRLELPLAEGRAARGARDTRGARPAGADRSERVGELAAG